MVKILQSEFGFNDIDIKKLDGYDNNNYLVIADDTKYVFKTYLYCDDLFDLIVAENETLLFLQKPSNNKYPNPIHFKDGSYIKILTINKENCICRMLSFIDGDFFGGINPIEKLFESFGVFIAKMDISLQNYTNDTIKVRKWEWDIQYLNLNEKFIGDILNINDRNLAIHFIQKFNENVRPILPNLRKQIIHNDANDWNVLVNNGVVTSIIDFGDLAHSLLINELAVAITYACFNKKDPLKWGAIILKSYHSILPIKAIEVKILYYLIAARLVISLSNSAHSKKNNPKNTYAYVSEKPAWQMLYHWLSIKPIIAENKFREAINLDFNIPL